MIITNLLKIVYDFMYLLTLPFRVLPDVTLPVFITGTIATASSYISSINHFLPITEMVYLLVVLFIAYESAYFGYKLIMWVIRKIPTIS
jgi:hypothetical protein